MYVARWFGSRATRPISIVAAAGSVVEGGSPAGPEAISRRSQEWQKRVLHLAGAIPEPSGAGALVRNSMNMVSLEVVGPPDPIKEAIEDAISGFDMGRAGELIWLVGETYPVWYQDGDEIVWDIHSPVEFKAEKGKPAKHYRMSDGKEEILPSGHKWYRNWQPDPARRSEAWSAHRALLDVMEAMYLHQRADTTVAKSRLAGAGILYWPTMLPSMPLRDGRPEEGSQEELQAHLSKAMTDSINDRDGLDAIVPMIVFGDPTTGENQKPDHILFERPDDAGAFASRMKAYRERYATGVELPIEAVTGVGAANHWTAWVVKEDQWRYYLSPLADIITRGLERNFAKPLARELGYSGPVKVLANGKALIAKPDRTDAAIRLAQLGGYLSDEAVLREAGFNPETDMGSGQRESNGRLKELPVQFRDTSPI